MTTINQQFSTAIQRPNGERYLFLWRPSDEARLLSLDPDDECLLTALIRARRHGSELVDSACPQTEGEVTGG